MKREQTNNQTFDKKQVSNISLPPFDDVMDIVSSTECTGMLCKPPITDEEVAAYTDIYAVKQVKDQPWPTSQLEDKE